jgi:hypothetical protein
MSKFSDAEAYVIFGFAVITGVGAGLISTHWVGATAAVGVGLLSFLVGFFAFANMAR